MEEPHDQKAALLLELKNQIRIIEETKTWSLITENIRQKLGQSEEIILKLKQEILGLFG